MLCSLGDREDPDPRANAVPNADDRAFRSRADEFDAMFAKSFNRAMPQRVLDERGIDAALPRLLGGMARDLHFIPTDIHNIS